MALKIGLFRTLIVALRFIYYRFLQFRLTTKDRKVITTSHGKVKGVRHQNIYGEEHGYYAFEGIPYAKPPLNELRFRAPQPPEPWLDVRDCTRPKSRPMQGHQVLEVVQGSEDCLYLNVYAKKLKSSSNTPLPVMVYIYGGGFQLGEASRTLYAPDYLMMRDMIVITFNYRLGVLGFLCLDDPDLNIPGNAGLKDQVMALKWIKENIHNFNGDPNNITVMAQSAGAVSLHMLMVSPQAKGLFHKAILHSGSVLCPWSFTERHDWGYKLACHLGYKGANSDKDVYYYLMQQDAKQLVDIDAVLLTKSDFQTNNMFYAFVPVVEPYASAHCIVNKPFRELLATAWGNDIPLIIGGTSAEGLFYHGRTLKRAYVVNDLEEMGLSHLFADDVKRSHTHEELENMAAKLKTTYFNNDLIVPTRDQLFEFLELLGHRNFWHPVYRAIRARTAYATKASTYCYYFQFESRSFNHNRYIQCSDTKAKGACHGDDISYLFGNFMAEKLSPARREFKCIQRMVSMWYNFALTSNPNCEEISPITWKCVENNEKDIECLVIGDELEFKKLPIYEKLQVWNTFYTKESLL